MALTPIQGRAEWALSPSEGDGDLEHPLAARFHRPVRWFAQDGYVAGQQIGAQGEEPGQAVVLPGHLFADVEDVGHVDGRVGQRGRQLEHHGQARLHVGRSETPQLIALDPGVLIAVGRDRIGVPGEDEPGWAIEPGPGHHVVLDPVDLEPRHGPQPLLPRGRRWPARDG